jgi:hypothetical protein
VFITDQTDKDIAPLEMRHRQRAHVEDRIRCGKATGLDAFPSHYWEFNEVWLELILIAQTLIAWVQLLCLTGAKLALDLGAEPRLHPAQATPRRSLIWHLSLTAEARSSCRLHKICPRKAFQGRRQTRTLTRQRRRATHR